MSELDSRDCKHPGCPDPADPKYTRGPAVGLCTTHAKEVFRDMSAKRGAGGSKKGEFEELARRAARAGRAFDKASRHLTIAKRQYNDACDEWEGRDSGDDRSRAAHGMRIERAIDRFLGWMQLERAEVEA